MANPYSVSTASGSYNVTLGSGRIISTLTNTSVSMYIKTTGSSGGNGGVLYCERAAAGNDIWKFQTNNITNSNLIFTHRDDAGTLNQPAASATINDGIWHHIVLTKAGTSIKFYVDGAQSGSTGTLTGTDTLTDASTVTLLGNDVADLGGSSFTGRVDEVLLFNTAISAADVSALYTLGTVPAGLIDTYHLNEGTGTSTADSTGSKNGVLSNSAMWSSDAPVLPTPQTNGPLRGNSPEQIIQAISGVNATMQVIFNRQLSAPQDNFYTTQAALNVGAGRSANQLGIQEALKANTGFVGQGSIQEILMYAYNNNLTMSKIVTGS